MIIDFHTHIFPEKIAVRAVSKLASCIHLEPAIDGRASDLQRSMEDAGVDISVVLPVVTDPKQFDSILRFAVYLNETFRDSERRIVSFAGIWPTDPNYVDQLRLIKSEGFSGVKIHPNYQNIEFSDIQCKRFLYKASELSLPVLTHAGFDPYTPDHEFCSPDMITEVLDEVAPENLILAHMGNNLFYDEAEKKICGRNVLLDTAYSIANMDNEQFVRMVSKHGADKVLFASDCPWAGQKKCVEVLQNSPLSDEEKELIFAKNALNLLKL